MSMPRWGMTMTEGTVAGWLAEAGAAVAPGDELVEIETTKVVNALEATAGGVLHRRLVDPGVTVPVGTLLGIIVEGGPSDAEIDAFVTGFAATAAAEADDADGAPAPQRLDVGGRTVNVLAMGSGGAAPALLVHGFGGAIDGWRFNQPAHADGLPPAVAVHRVDGAGHMPHVEQAGAVNRRLLDFMRAAESA